MNRYGCLCAAALALAMPLAADGRETGAHVHGRVDMAVVSEASALTVEIRSPLYNILGFERAPSGTAELATWKAAAATVDAPAKLFTLDKAAGCVLRSKDTGVLGPPPPAGQHANAASHGHDDHDHDEEPGHAGLSDVTLRYAFECAQPSKLSRISVQAFGAFRHIEAVELVYLDGVRQKAKTLTAKSPEFRTR